ncbi:DNA ligase D [Dyadobacter sp. 32]|uniref:DNA ligase D n=1 Tax=Dyadobacter sp. 32 TaxID=538966 RepID=UPI0011EC3B16
MSIVKYKQKRSFNKTPEPEGGESDGTVHRFVIQKHAASRLHYDFRLEMEGVLKSWAVPKGPSLDPAVKRLAVMVEDHPYDYRTFEGIIPKGEYGGGTVMVWDEGTYEPAEGAQHDKAANDKNLRHQLHAGKVKFVLKGTKLKGLFALVKAHGREENAWLLMKLEDQYTSEKDILQSDKSAVSGKTLEELTATSDAIYGQKSKTANQTKKSKKPLTKKALEKTADKQMDPAPDTVTDVPALLKKAPKCKFDLTLKPMLATLVDAPFDDTGWRYEIKWDGYRALAFLNKGVTELKSRNSKSFNDQFYPVYDALKRWGINAIVDGEIVVVDDKGISRFNLLQNWRSEADGELLFYVFDVLWLDGKDLTGLTQQARNAILQTLIPKESNIRSGFSVEASGTDFFGVAKEMGLEGIIAKRSDSLYRPGERSKDWLKIKVQKRQEVVIAGYTRNEGTAKQFSSLLLGAYRAGKLQYVGKVGTGFTDRQQKEMLARFEPLTIKKTPFEELPDYNKPSRFRPNPPLASATWLKPELVCEISFAEITDDGVFRHPSFVGMREDKNAKEVVLESAADAETIVNVQDESIKQQIIMPTLKIAGGTLLNPTEKTQVKQVNGHELKFTNLDKIFWPEEKISKRDLVNYYYQMASYMLPYLKDRPQSLNRHPNGITGKSFYQKDVTGKVPDWMKTYLYHADGDEQDKHFLVGDDEATLLFMANQGVIEMNPWNSTVLKPDHPTWCIIDLDPGKNTFEQVIEAARVTKEVLDNMEVPSFPKTSGSTGLHIYIPLGSKYTYEQSREFARVIVTLVHEQIPEFTSLERAVASRKGKMYLDFLQNRSQATIAAPYAVRPKPGATVSMPLEWDEVKPGLKMKDFTIFNALERVKEKGDLFSPILGEGIDLEKITGRF